MIDVVLYPLIEKFIWKIEKNRILLDLNLNQNEVILADFSFGNFITMR